MDKKEKKVGREENRKVKTWYKEEERREKQTKETLQMPNKEMWWRTTKASRIHHMDITSYGYMKSRVKRVKQVKQD